MISAHKQIPVLKVEFYVSFKEHRVYNEMQYETSLIRSFVWLNSTFVFNLWSKNIAQGLRDIRNIRRQLHHVEPKPSSFNPEYFKVTQTLKMDIRLTANKDNFIYRCLRALNFE